MHEMWLGLVMLLIGWEYVSFGVIWQKESMDFIGWDWVYWLGWRIGVCGIDKRREIIVNSLMVPLAQRSYIIKT